MSSPARTPPRRSWWARHHMSLAPWLFLAPGLFLFTVYVLGPIVESMGLSLYKWDGLGTARWVGLANYLRLGSDPAFLTALRNNLIWLFGYLLSVPIGLALALLLNQTMAGLRLMKSAFFFPFVISQVVIGLVFTLFYDPTSGLFVHLLHALGLPPVAVLSNSHLVTYGIVAAGLYPQIAYCMILYLTGLNGVRADLIEAARLEGAKGWSMLFKVVLPQLRPATFIAVVVTVIGSLRSFDMISIMTQGGPYGSSRTLAYYMYEVALSEYGYRMGYGAAVATVLFFIMLVFIVFVLRRVYLQEKENA
ncbi:MAG: sugar ABC transporter permease [Betaproteobacteria bacterium]|nr:sugar ABC transporter permease [Betaproteobacteria bacterium]MBU6512168.1 sugar ABC transporter permease [Betaproteobacteria bacterium]MDE1954527.1 sugar ABC transporter permease [Betaproteobacteria bacterium]MDE2151906.1 sugar ABC transporter permease [Betaproteobacteria bacterium]MDE2478430.1 sugar ABC transporter permease [Betaproteobacteria bacterium]